MPRAWIGTSGWNYGEWKDGFYENVASGGRLGYYAGKFPAVEVNATFYRTPAQGTVEGWLEQTPAEFLFTVKAYRRLTHLKKLKSEPESMEIFRKTVARFGDRAAVVLWQLPGNFPANTERLARFCEDLSDWDGQRHVMELRHDSWFTDEVAVILGEAGIGIVQSDAPDWPQWDRVTGAVGYARLHGHTRLYRSKYATRSLERWAGWVAGCQDDGRDAWVFFDNTGEGHAPRDAQRLMEMVRS